MIKNKLEEVLRGMNEFKTDKVDWKELEKAVREEGVKESSSLKRVEEVVKDLFWSVGYEEFGVKALRK